MITSCRFLPANPSVVVCNVRAPYSFRQCFYAILYSRYHLTSKQNSTEIVTGKPLRRWLNSRGQPNVSMLDISETVRDTASDTVND